jgi:hypothetical protein
MPLQVFRPEEAEGDGVILVSCEPYLILGHAKVDFVVPDGEEKFASPTAPLDEIYDALPVSVALRKALRQGDEVSRETKLIPLGPGARVRRGAYVYLTVCSSEKEDYTKPTGEFIDWRTEQELLAKGAADKPSGGKEAVIAYINRSGLPASAEVSRILESLTESAIISIEAVDSRRRAHVLPLLNDPRSFLAFSGKGYVLGQAGSSPPVRNEPGPLRSRDKSVRRFHEGLKAYRASARRKFKQSAARDARFQAALEAYRSDAMEKYKRSLSDDRGSSRLRRVAKRR